MLYSSQLKAWQNRNVELMLEAVGTSFLTNVFQQSTFYACGPA